MTPGAGYNKAGVGGNNIQALMGQILQPYDPSKRGAQNAPISAGLGTYRRDRGGRASGRAAAEHPSIASRRATAGGTAAGRRVCWPERRGRRLEYLAGLGPIPESGVPHGH